MLFLHLFQIVSTMGGEAGIHYNPNLPLRPGICTSEQERYRQWTQRQKNRPRVLPASYYDAGFTLRTYTHTTNRQQAEAADMMGSLVAQSL